MKKIVFALLILSLTCLVYAEGDYRGGNGTLIKKEKIGDKTIEIRKYEKSNFYCEIPAPDYTDFDGTLYDDYLKKNKIGNLETEKTIIINFYEICFVTDTKDKQKGELWIKLSDGKNTGWICEKHASNPYEDDEYSYLESIKSGSETYYVRKYSYGVEWWKGYDHRCWQVDNITVRDKPGEDSKIVAEIPTGTSDQIYFNSIAITEDESWVKIEYKKGKYGWVDSSCVFNREIGPRFHNPDIVILLPFISMSI